MNRSTQTLAQQVGQLLIMGFEASEPTAHLRSMLSALQPGGVVLFARNIVDPRQTWELLRECRRCVSTPMFCCVDMEGGTVDRLKNVVAPAPSAAEVFASGNRKLFRLHGRVIGDEVRAFGFNVDFAPCCDLALPPSQTVLTSRAVSPDPRKVTSYAREFLRGLADAKVLGCGKHFPGLGKGALDTHQKLARIEGSLLKLWNEDAVPYRELHSHMPFVMVSHAAYPGVTGEAVPASLSQKWITDVLRHRIGYRGVVVSDDLEMGAAILGAHAHYEDDRRPAPSKASRTSHPERSARAPERKSHASRAQGSKASREQATGDHGAEGAEYIARAALGTLKAGADMYLVCRRADAVMNSFQSIVREAERDRRFAERVNESAARVLALKKKAALDKRRCPAPSDEVVSKVRRKLWELGEEIRLARLLV
jgi:beta-N-acetylhexosaminidase